eukprot:6213222-Pleurochrysis_carterae.AAC.1
MERIALSATPFSWCTCGGHVEVCTPSDARRSRAHDARGRWASRVQWCVEGCYELADLARRFVLLLQQVDRLITGVVVYDHERIFAGAVDGLDEGPGDVYVYETPGISKLSKTEAGIAIGWRARPTRATEVP